MLTRRVSVIHIGFGLVCLLTLGCNQRRPAWPVDEGLPVVDAGGAEGGADTIAADTAAADGPVGDPGWLLMLTGSGDVGFSNLAVDDRGNALVAAVFEQTASLGPNHQVSAVGGSDSQNFLLAKVDTDGAVQWVVTGHGGAVAGLAPDGAGGAYVVVRVSVEATFGNRHLTGLAYGSLLVARVSTGGEVAWAVASSGDDGAMGWGSANVVGLPTGPVLASGLEKQVSLGGAALVPQSSNAVGFVLWLDGADGSALHSMVSGDLATPGYSPSTWFDGIVVDEGGDLRLGGGTDHSVFAARIDSPGKPSWVKVAWGGGNSNYYFGGLDVGPAGQTYFAGSGACEEVYPFTLGSLTLPLCNIPPPLSSLPLRCFVARLEHDGAPAWLVGSQVVGQERCRPLSVAAAPGALHVAGTYHGALTFGGCSLPAAGDSDHVGLFALRFNDAGTCERSIGPLGLTTSTSALDPALEVATHDGKVWLAGGFTGAATFGPLGSRAAVKTDGFLWRLPDPIP